MVTNMYKVNQHLKPDADGTIRLPDSFLYCKGDKTNEFYAWKEGNDLIIETTISNSKILVQAIKEWEAEHEEIHMDYMELFCEALPDYSEGNIWCDGGTEILCRTESAAQAVADLLELLYRKDGKEILINTGYYDPEEDKRNGEEDRYTGWYYVNVD